LRKAPSGNQKLGSESNKLNIGKSKTLKVGIQNTASGAEKASETPSQIMPIQRGANQPVQVIGILEVLKQRSNFDIK
jgi:hypothetical protein